MTVGLSTTTADGWLNTLRNASFTAAATFVQLHTGDPGAAGTANVSSVTTRPSITFAAAASGGGGRQLATSNAPAWSSWAGTNGEVVTHISIWSLASGGTFYASIQLTASKTMGTGDTLTLTSGATTITLTPIAA